MLTVAVASGAALPAQLPPMARLAIMYIAVFISEGVATCPTSAPSTKKVSVYGVHSTANVCWPAVRLAVFDQYPWSGVVEDLKPQCDWSGCVPSASSTSSSVERPCGLVGSIQKAGHAPGVPDSVAVI